jgi:hypothetical protein
MKEGEKGRKEGEKGKEGREMRRREDRRKEGKKADVDDRNTPRIEARQRQKEKGRRPICWGGESKQRRGTEGHQKVAPLALFPSFFEHRV